MADIEQRLKFLLDRGSQRQAEQGVRDLRNEMNSLLREFRRGNSSYDEARASIKSLAQQFDVGADRAEFFRKSIRQLRNEQERLNSAAASQERFDRTSRSVALAGDVQSNLGALSGIAGAAGAGGLGSGIAVGGEVVALIEELPRLKEAARGLPATFSNAAAALGTTSTGLLGALGAAGIALVALNLAFQAFQREAERTKEVVRAQADAVRTLNELRASDASGSDFLDTQTRLQQQYETAKATVEDLTSAYEAQYEGTTKLYQAISRTISVQEEEQVRAIQEQESELRKAKAALDEFNQGLTGTEQAAVDAAYELRKQEAFMEQQEELAAGVLTEASLLAELNQFRRDSVDLTKEEIEAKKAELEARRVALSDELRVLEQSGNQSDSVRNRIDALNTELGNLDDKLEVLSNTTAKASEETEKAARRVAPARSTRGGFLLTGRGGSGFAQGTPAVNAALQEVYNEFAVKAFEAQSGLSESLRDVNKELSRSFEDLRINQSRDIEDAIRTGDILGIRDITRGVQRQAQDLNRDAARNRLDIEQDFTTQMIDLAQDRRNAILEAERQITESVRRTASRIGGLVLPSGNNGFSFGSAPRT